MNPFDPAFPFGPRDDKLVSDEQSGDETEDGTTGGAGNTETGDETGGTDDAETGDDIGGTEGGEEDDGKARKGPSTRTTIQTRSHRCSASDLVCHRSRRRDLPQAFEG